MKKIFILTFEYPYGVGEQFFETEVSFLSKEFDITILSLHGSKRTKPTRNCPKNVNVIPLNYPRNKFYHSFKALFSDVKDFKSEYKTYTEKLLFCYYLNRQKDIAKRILKVFNDNNKISEHLVLYSYWLSFSYSLSLVRTKLQKVSYYKIPLITRAHGYDLFWERMPKNYPGLQRKSIESVDSVYSVSATGTKYLQSKYPEFSNKIHTERLGTLDNGCGYTKRNISFMTCSNNRKVKRLDLFAEAFSNFCDKNPNAIWHAVGLSGRERNILKALGNNKKNVCFYGNLENHQVIDFYKKSNDILCFVNVSSSEGLPVSIMEAMSFGLPIIATDVGGVSELVSEENGILLAANPLAQEIKTAMERISSLSDNEINLISLKSREKWNLVANAEKNYNNWIKILENL